VGASLHGTAGRPGRPDPGTRAPAGRYRACLRTRNAPPAVTHTRRHPRPGATTVGTIPYSYGYGGQSPARLRDHRRAPGCGGSWARCSSLACWLWWGSSPQTSRSGFPWQSRRSVRTPGTSRVISPPRAIPRSPAPSSVTTATHRQGAGSSSPGSTRIKRSPVTTTSVNRVSGVSNTVVITGHCVGLTCPALNNVITRSDTTDTTTPPASNNRSHTTRAPRKITKSATATSSNVADRAMPASSGSISEADSRSGRRAR